MNLRWKKYLNGLIYLRFVFDKVYICGIIISTKTILHMKNTKRTYFFISVTIVSVFLVSFTIFHTEGWVVPKSANSIKNPLKRDKKSIAEGEKLFNQMCAVCHGNKGKGNGVAGASLNPKPANFWKEEIQKQTDGALFWKLNKGRGAMSSFSHLKENQKWQLINYIRTFKK